MPTTITTTPNTFGWESISKIGAESTFWGVSLIDSHNYTVTADQTIIPPTNGISTITAEFCGEFGNNGMIGSPLTPQEVTEIFGNVQLNYTNINCKTGEWTLPSPKITINLGVLVNYLNTLSTTPYNFSMSNLTFPIWDYISAVISGRNLTTNTQETVKQVTNFSNIIVNFDSKVDEDKWEKINSIGVNVENGTKVVDTSGDYRFTFPFQTYFNSGVIGGKSIPGSSFTLFVGPHSWYYDTNEGPQTITTVENNPGRFTRISPAVLIGNDYYSLSTSTPFPTDNDPVGYFLNMTNSTGVNAIKGFADLTFLASKTLLTYNSSTGIYSDTINMTFDVAHPETNNLSKSGNKVSVTYIFDPSVTDNNIDNFITHQ